MLLIWSLDDRDGDSSSCLSSAKEPTNWLRYFFFPPRFQNMRELLRIGLVDVSSTTGWHIPHRLRVLYL